MILDQVIRAWKDPAFRAGMSETERQALPANPAGLVELGEGELTETKGGTSIPCSVMFLIIRLTTDNP